MIFLFVFNHLYAMIHDEIDTRPAKKSKSKRKTNFQTHLSTDMCNNLMKVWKNGGSARRNSHVNTSLTDKRAKLPQNDQFENGIIVVLT